MRIGILVPHIFAQDEVINDVVFAPADLVVKLVDGLVNSDHEVTLFTPGKFTSKAQNNITVDLSLFNNELKKEDCSASELISKSPLSFVSLSRQIQAELTAKAFKYCDENEFDVLHVYICENELPLYFADLMATPMLFTHHDPYNFYRKYRARFPKLRNLNYVSISKAQQKTAPNGMNFVANVYNGIDMKDFEFYAEPQNADDSYFVNIGRIIRVKGIHTAISACQEIGETFRFAGKYYTQDQDEDNYWSKYIQPHVDDKKIFYEGFINDRDKKSEFLGKAKAFLFPIEWDEPFGMVLIEAMACGTPVIAFDRGPVREIVEDGVTGFIVKDKQGMMNAMRKIHLIDRETCRKHVKENFSIQNMVNEYVKIYSEISES